MSTRSDWFLFTARNPAAGKQKKIHGVWRGKESMAGDKEGNQFEWSFGWGKWIGEFRKGGEIEIKRDRDGWVQERKGYSMNSYFMGLKQEEGG